MSDEQDKRVDDKVRSDDELLSNLPEPPAVPTPDSSPTIPDTSTPIISARDEEGLTAPVTHAKPPEAPDTRKPIETHSSPELEAPAALTQDDPTRVTTVPIPEEPGIKLDFPSIDLSDAIPVEEIEPDVDTDIIRAIQDYGRAVNELLAEISMRVDELTVSVEELRSRYYRHP